AGVGGKGGRGCRTHEHRVPGGVDETWQERAPACVDDRHLGVGRYWKTAARNPFDGVAVHHHVPGVRELLRLAVEDAHVSKQGERNLRSCGCCAGSAWAWR